MQAPDPDNAQPPRTRTRHKWFERAPINLGELVVETGAVVFGILLALGINSWYEGRKDRALVDSALHSLRAEIGRNRDAASNHQQRMEAMADAMARDNAKDAEPRSCMSWKGWAGFEQPVLLDTAYEVAIMTQALAKMPFEEASRIGQIYGAQRYIQHMYDKAGDMLIAERPAALGLCVGVSREVARGSSGLVERYDTLLQAH